LPRFVRWMQLRTRAFDDVLRSFLARGGRQVVLLGAGYDCRALRFAAQLEGVRFFEVDHPATQAQKRAVLASAQLSSQARYVAWDFERDPLAMLRSRLEAQGLSQREPVLTFWEGVTMYLSEGAIADTLAVVRSFGSPGSWLAFNYVDRRALRLPDGEQRLSQWLAKSVGEPHRFGWDPAALPAWLTQRGYRCLSDRSDWELAQTWFQDEAASAFAAANRHVVLAETR
ncbi:MAG TPA: SAM-dependent methyltransferase, partial [Polyangiales bacterium]